MNSKSFNRYMLDSNVFDYLLENGIPPSKVKDAGELYITSIQESEIQNTSDEARRRKLMDLLDQIAPKKIAVMTGFWHDDLHWDDDAPWKDYPGEIASDFFGLQRNPNAWKDATIGEVAKLEMCVLVTSDSKMSKRAKKQSVVVAEPADIFPG